MYAFYSILCSKLLSELAMALNLFMINSVAKFIVIFIQQWRKHLPFFIDFNKLQTVLWVKTMYHIIVIL